METRAELQDCMLCHKTRRWTPKKQPQPLLETPKIMKRLRNGDRFYCRNGHGLSVFSVRSVLNLFFRLNEKDFNTERTEGRREKQEEEHVMAGNLFNPAKKGFWRIAIIVLACLAA